MNKIRLFKLAKELNVNPNEIISFLRKNSNISGLNRNTLLDSKQSLQLTRQFGDEKLNEKLNENINSKFKTINKNSKSNLVTIGELFEGRLFRIPDYQRGFSWSEKELDALWKDLNDITGVSMHFTGIISLEPIDKDNINRLTKENNISESAFTKELDLEINNDVYTPYFIVDGQQRLTSLIVLLTVLLEEFSELEDHKDNSQLINDLFTTSDGEVFRFGYEKDTPSHQFLLNKIFNDKNVEITEPETIYTKNLLKAKEFFQERINPIPSNNKEEEIEDNIRMNINQKVSLFNKIQNNLLFNILILDNSQVDISMVFETLNYRGKPLSKLEILKNRLMFLTSKKYKDEIYKIKEYREKITLVWLELYEWLGKGKTNINQIDDDSFLRAFWIMYFNHDDRKETRFSEFESDLFDNKFKINDTSTNVFLEQEKLEDMLNSILLAVRAWHYINHPNHKEQANEVFVSDEFSYYLQLLNKISQGKYIQPLIMSVICNVFNKDENDDKTFKLEFIKEVERHNAVLFLINGKSTDTNRAQSWRYSNVVFEARHGRKLNERLSGINTDYIMSFFSKSINKYHRVDHFSEHIHSNRMNNEKFWDWNGRDYLLLQWEWSLRNTPVKERNTSLKYRTYRLYSQNSEHSFKPHFFLDLERANLSSSLSIQNSIGNIFIGSPIPKKVKDFNAIELKFQNENQFLLQKNNQKIQHWSYETIRQRGEAFLSFISNHYRISLGPENEWKKIILQGVQDKSNL